jgi:hypothetical protein
VYSADRSLDETLTVGDGDLVLVPRGYHVVAAAPGYDCYYLNIMAGSVREWDLTVDPEHTWLMDWDPARPTGHPGPEPGELDPMETPIPLRPLERTAATTPTAYWNDSCAVDELADAIVHGAVGATTNPPIVLEVLKKDPAHWAARARELYAEHPTASEADLTWRIIEELAVRGAALLVPAFERSGGAVGRLSLQTNPKLYRDTAAIVAQAEHFGTLAPNLQVKVPATAAGIAAVEEATWRGVQINAPVSFTVPQALAVRGGGRAASAGPSPAEAALSAWFSPATADARGRSRSCHPGRGLPPSIRGPRVTESRGPRILARSRTRACRC